MAITNSSSQRVLVRITVQTEDLYMLKSRTLKFFLQQLIRIASTLPNLCSQP